MPILNYQYPDLVQRLAAMLAQGQRDQEERSIHEQQLARQARLDAANEEDRQRQHASEDLAQQVQAANLERAQAAQTTLAEAPTVPLGSEKLPALTEEHGGLSPDEAAFIGTETQVPKRQLEALTLPSGKKIPLAPLQYKPEVEAEARRVQAETFADTLQQLGLRENLLEGIRAQYRNSPLKDFLDTKTKKPVTLTEQQFLKAQQDEPGRYEPMRTGVNVNVKAPGTAGGTSAIVPLLQAANWKLKGQEFLQSLDPMAQDLIGGLLDGSLGAEKATSLRSGERALVTAAVRHVDPTWSMATFNARAQTLKDFTSGTGVANSLTSLNQLADHLKVLKDSFAAEQNGDMPGVNRFVNWVKTSLGHPEVTNAQTARTAVGEEVARLMRGGVGTEGEAKEWEQNFNVAGSPEQQFGAIATAQKLVRGRFGALKQRWHAAMKTDKGFEDFLEPAAQEMFGASGGGTAAPGAPAGGSAKDPARPIKYQGKLVPFSQLPPEMQARVVAAGG